MPTDFSRSSRWVAVDLDGTLAEYDYWRGIEHIGRPVPQMLKRVEEWLAAGVDVRIFTARAGIPRGIEVVERWLTEHGIGGLAVTNVKDFGMIELWDDRAIQVVPNRGIPLLASRRRRRYKAANNAA